MSEKVLFVDDELKILNGFSRQFEDILEFETAISPEDALDLLDREGPFAVIITDMRMPGMTGIELLSCVKERSPDTVRIMLTGHADLRVTMEAVNKGNIFRFLSKPCPQDVLEKAVRDGLAQYGLVTAERELLEGTLHGSIKVLSEMLSLVSPLAFGRTSQIQRIALAIGREMQLANLWDLKIATMLFPLGCVTIPESALECALEGRPVPEHERDGFTQHASIARRMLDKIPRLESVASIVAYQDKCYDGSGNPQDDVSGDEIPIGARILKVASDFQIAYKRLEDALVAREQLDGRTGHYDPAVLESLRNALQNGLCQSSQREIVIEELVEGMVLASDVRSANGQLMVTSGQEVTDSIRRRLRRLCYNGMIQNEFQIEVLRTVESPELATI